MEMTVTRPSHPNVTLPLRFVGGVVLAMVGAIVFFYFRMHPPMKDLQELTRYLTITAVISVVAGYGGYRSGILNLSPNLTWTLLGGYALSSLLTLLNVLYASSLMFFNQDHDLQLVIVLLFFASGIAMSLGYFLSATVTAKIFSLSQAADQIAKGELEARVSVEGRDEMAALALSFNEMAAQLEEAARKKKELERMRRDLIAWVGHDLRTPLASIRAIVEAIADGVVEEPTEVKRYLDTVKRDIGALSVLINDLFEMAQLDAGLQLEQDAISISDLLSDTLESFSAIAHQGGIKLEGGVAEGSDPVFVDVQKVGRVLSNLISNAIRYTPDGGKIEVYAKPKGKEVEIKVCDTGKGISPEDLPHIFERFYRGEKSRNRSTGGSGLGLAISKRIVEAHGGQIQAESTIGKGTCMIFTLPRPQS